MQNATRASYDRGAMRSSVLVVVVVVVIGVAGVGCVDDPPVTLGVTAQEHEAFFPISAGAKHALDVVAQDGKPISCDSCHAGTDSFKTALCVSCHSHDARPLAVVHAPVAGFELKDATCLTCHPTGAIGDLIGVASHSAQWFKIDVTDVHGGAAFRARVPAQSTSCDSCHASAEDRTQAQCVACHELDVVPLATAHAALPPGSFEKSNVSCKQCHADTPILAVMHPLSGHDAIFSTNHHGATCKSCHQQARVDRPWTIDFASGVCTQCHVAACNVGNQSACP